MQKTRAFAQNNHTDRLLLGVGAILVLLGLLFLASASIPLSYKQFGAPYYYLLHQIELGIVPGLILGFAAWRIPLAFFKKWSWVLLLLNIFLLSLIFVPGIGAGLRGADRWLRFGPISFQPTETLKLTFILYMASWFSVRNRSSGTFIAFLFAIAVVASLLLLQPDVSTLGIIFVTAILMYFLAGYPLWHIVLAVGLGAAAFFVLIKTAAYRYNRIAVFLKSLFLKSGIDSMGLGWQIQQALVGIGSGGLLGVGLGMSHQKFGNLPFPMSDSVFAIVAEETGFVGGFLLVALFLLFLWQAFNIAKRSQDSFCRLTAFGISFWIALQALVNIAALVGILPLTGIPLPFISYGGSALITELAAVGLLLNISKQSSKV